MKYLIVSNEAGWLELIRRVNHQLGYPNHDTKTTRYTTKWTHADGRRCLVIEDADYSSISPCLTAGEIAAITTSPPAGFSMTATAATGEFGHDALVCIACEGDSIITCDYNKDGGGWFAESEKFYYQLMDQMGSHAAYQAVNLGLGGSKVADLVSRAAVNIDNLNWTSGATKILLLWVGTNDIHHDGTAASVVVDNLVSYISARKAATTGLHVIVLTPIARSTSTTQQRAYRQELLDRQAAGTLGADAISDVGNLSIFDAAADVTNNTYYVLDQVHPQVAAQTIAATQVASDILTYIGTL